MVVTMRWLFVVYFLVWSCVNSLDFVLERFMTEECFFEDITEETEFNIQYYVLEGGFTDVDFKILNTKNEAIVVHNSKNSDEFKITQHIPGRYFFCFSNENSSKSSKRIIFSISPFRKYQQRTRQDANQKNHTHHDSKIEAGVTFDRIMKAIIDLSMDLSKVKREQEIIEIQDMAVINDYNKVGSYFLYWTVFEVIVVIIVAVYQIFYFTRIFEVRRMI